MLAGGLAACSTTAQPQSIATTTQVATSPSPSPSPTGEPQTYEGAKAAVDRMDAAAAKHDGATLWDMLTSSGQAAMSKADYIKVTNACPKLVASEHTLSIALNSAGTTATITDAVDQDHGGGTATWSLVYEGGHWKHQPSDGAMQWMSLGADKALTVLRGDGDC